MNIINKIRNEQINHGYGPCFATSTAEYCGEVNCSHREKCLFFDDKNKDQEIYIESVFGHITDPVKKELAIDNAFKTALDIRKFEIELYWKRAAYFWVFITASFAGFFWAVQQDKPTDKTDNILFIMTCMGLSASWAWCLVLRGSKYWQENWEKHVDYLEDYSAGKLYKYVKSGKDLKHKDILASYPYSVSKVNCLLGHFIFAIWLVVLFYVLYYLSIPPRIDDSSLLSWYIRTFFAGLSVSFITISSWDCKTTNSEYIMTSKDNFYCRDYTSNKIYLYDESELDKRILLLVLSTIMIILWIPHFI